MTLTFNNMNKHQSKSAVIALSELFSPFIFEIQFELGLVNLLLRLVEVLVSEGVNRDRNIFTVVLGLSLLPLQLPPEELQLQPLLHHGFSKDTTCQFSYEGLCINPTWRPPPSVCPPPEDLPYPCDGDSSLCDDF